MKRAYCLILLFLLGCVNASVFSDYQKGNNFAVYKTFAWSPEAHHPHKNAKFDNQIIESNIKNYVTTEMENRGYTIDVNDPDLILDFDVMVEKRVQTVSTPVYSHPNNYRGSYGYSRYNNNGYNNGMYNYNGGMQYQVGTRTRNIPYKEGTLTIDIIDRRNNNQLVWKGWAVTTVTDPVSFDNELKKDIHAVLKKYPVPVIKNNQ